jgi:nicotinate-nucleotide adenylyltransferase
MPAGTPPHKPGGHGGWDPGPQHRLRMCQLLVEDGHRLSACALEIDRGGPSYTVDTLNAIHASHPDARLTLIVGADIASTLASWRQPRELLGLARLAVAGRSGSDRRQVREVLAGLGGEDVSFLEMAPVEVSSSMARLRAARGEPIDEIVGPAIARHIAEHRLYQQETR